ncbi:MAG: DNA mismatch repair protein MutS [Defluviitaleaceae bacterium]|nr:DNA mismatch repair protein MutS [Defluviitaleaceae bacterium]
MTPMMSQYHEIKKKYTDCLLLFRLGDFYELFFEDAITASRELDIALTGRECGEEERAPMCGVPHHSAEGYISQLVEKGYRVALCEQMEPAKPGKGIVKRDVVQVITPGTITDVHMLEENKNNYILCLHHIKKGCALAAADITTGTFTATYFPLEDVEAGKRIVDEMSRFHPSEVLLSEDSPYASLIEKAFAIKPTLLPPWAFSSDFAYKSLNAHFRTMHLEGFGLKEDAPEVTVAGALLNYLKDTQKGTLDQITALKPYYIGGFLVLDKNTRQNLELTTPLRPWNTNRSRKKPDSTLLSVLDRTCTAMGGRLLRSWIDMPLMDIPAINQRLDAVEEWTLNAFLRTELRDSLKEIHDMERLTARLAGRNGNGRDMAAFKASISCLPSIKEKLWETKSPLNLSMYKTFDELKDIYTLLDTALVEEPPLSIKEGDLIKAGYNSELDQFLDIKENGTAWLEALESKERAATGIKSLKVRYNRVFGYYIEVTKSHLAAVPSNYIRKQTLANSERYTTEELDKLAETILNANDKRAELEYALFEELRQAVVHNMQRIQFAASLIATLDVLQSLGDVADRNRYCKPIVDNGETIYIRAGRHPVLEQSSPFVANNTHLDGTDRRMLVITGPNMAGKSTYMRQVALITLMAQIGSFVPAEEASIGVVDRIFTRVGASDDLAGGQSTFMVEMTEVAHILHHATRRSLIIMDEIGRGTSTFDGLSIAWAVLEYIANEECIGAKTLFATHYHELTVMEERLPGVKNYSFTLGETEDGEILFIRKLTRGGADRSYGIQVAKLAGLPLVVLRRARKVLEALEGVNSYINTSDIEPPHAIFFSEDKENEGDL